jgi:hypothetical protein
VEGTVTDSMRNGVFYFNTYINNQKISYSETYKSGILKKDKNKVNVLNSSNTVFNLNDVDLSKIDKFLHTNMIFVVGAEGEQKLVDFLINNSFIEMPAAAQTFSDNTFSFFQIIARVLGKETIKQHEVYNFLQ